MGILKTAMMSGAAMYGMKKFTESRPAAAQSSPPPPPPQPQRRGYYDQDEQYDIEDQNYRYREQYLLPRSSQRGQQDSGYYREDPRQYVNSDDYTPYNRGNYPPERPTQREYPMSPQREYSMPPAYQQTLPPAMPARYRAQGFVEPEEIVDTQQGASSSSRADMMNMLAQQAMSMGILGGKDSQKNGGKGDVLKNLLGR